MLVVWKILRLFVNTMTDDEKYSFLYRENLTQPILSIFETYIKFCTFSKKDDLHSRCISQITVSEKGD